MSLAPPPAGSSNTLVADALARAQALAKTGIKRPGEYIDQPDAKKPNFPNMMQQQGGVTEQIYVPDNMVGLLIGRGGENITRMQQESGCKIQMSQDNQGQPTRLCTLTGSPEAIVAAKAQVDAVIRNDNGRQGGGGRPPMGGGGGMGGGFEMMLEGPLVARVIGKGGENIKRLQEETGAKIVIIQDSKDFADQKPLRISGPPDKVEYAKQRVMQVIQEEREKLNGMGGGRGGGRGGFRGGPGGRGGGGFRGGRGGPGGGRGGGSGWPSEGGGGGYGGEVQDTYAVPSNKVGLVMGKGGETIKSICAQSGAHCQVDKTAPEGAREKTIVIKGTPDAVEQAKALIAEKVGGGGGGGYGGPPGGPGSNGGHYRQPEPAYGQYEPPQTQYQPAPAQPAAVPVNPSTGQPDYSAQWAEYYRSLGMVKEAELIETQGRGGPPAAAPQPAMAPAQPAATDYSAQWADYYRSIGKVQEAEAIEKNMRAKSGSVPPAGYPQPQPGYGVGAPQPGYGAPQPGYY